MTPGYYHCQLFIIIVIKCNRKSKQLMIFSAGLLVKVYSILWYICTLYVYVLNFKKKFFIYIFHCLLFILEYKYISGEKYIYDNIFVKHFFN